MKGVVHHFQVRVIGIAAETRIIRSVGKKIAFKPVQVLANQSHIAFLSVIGRFGQNLERPLPLVSRWTGSAKRSQGRMDWSDKMRCPRSGNHIDRFFQSIERRCTDRGIGRDRIIGIRTDRHRGSL